MKKRWCSALLALALLLTLLPAAVFAEDAGIASNATRTITVRAEWSGFASPETPDNVTVALFKNTRTDSSQTDSTPEQVGAAVELNAANSWTHSFTADTLDADGNEIRYSVRETGIAGASFRGTEPNVNFGDGPKTCDVFEISDKTGKWYAAYTDTIQTDGCVTITNQYAKNAVVVHKEIVEIQRGSEYIYTNRDGSNLSNVPALRAGDRIEYKISVYNNTDSTKTVKIYDWLTGGKTAVKILDEAIDKEYAANDPTGLRQNESQQIEAGATFLISAAYTVQTGDGQRDSTDDKYYLTNEVNVHYGGVIYSDTVKTEIEKDPDAYKIYVPIIKTLYNDGTDAFDGERFGFTLYTEDQADPKYNWNAYISVDKVPAGGFTHEANVESGKPTTVIELTEAEFEDLPVDEMTGRPYLLISEIKGSSDRVTYDTAAHKLYLVPEKDSGSPLALLAAAYDPAETHIYYAIADLTEWNKEGSKPYACAAEFFNYYDKQEGPALYTIRFDANGGTLTGEATARTGSDGKLASLPTPARGGSYTFDGWYTEKTGGTEVTTETVFTADATVYAHWTYTGGHGGGSTRCTLTYESNGGTPYSSTTHTYGTVVKLDKIPVRTGYTFTGWYADKGLTEPITEIKMTGSKTVYAGWESASALNSKDHIAYIVGYADGLVHPTDNITRGQVATVLFRLLNAGRRDAIFTTSNPFRDVSVNNWYNNMVSSMANGGYLYGYPDGSFGGDNSITRAEFVAMLVRFIGVDDSAAASFSDVSSSFWAYQYIATASSAGWIQGFSDGTFRPSQNLTRAEAMTILNRVLNRGVDADSTLPDGAVRFEDNSPSAWYYYDVIEATNDHEYTGSRPSEDWSSLQIDYVYDIAKYEHP